MQVVRQAGVEESRRRVDVVVKFLEPVVHDLLGLYATEFRRQKTGHP